MGRTSGEKADHSSAFPQSHDRSVSVTWEKYQHSRFIENTEIGFLVESVLGVEPLLLCQNSAPLAKPLIQNVYLCNDRDELVLGLDASRLLSIC